MPSKGETTLKAGKLDKLGVKDKTKWISRFCVLTQTSLKYYTNEGEFREKPVFEQGSIPLKSIIHIIPVYRDDVVKSYERPGFKIGAVKWYKGPNENGYRDFRFACDNNEEVENWLIHIEYIRARAIYEEFISTVDPRIYGASANLGSAKKMDSLPGSPKGGRVKEVGFNVNNDLSVGEKLGYGSGRETGPVSGGSPLTKKSFLS